MIVYDNYDIGYDMAIWYLVIYNCSRYMFEVTQAALHDRGAIERSELGDEHQINSVRANIVYLKYQ